MIVSSSSNNNVASSSNNCPTSCTMNNGSANALAFNAYSCKYSQLSSIPSSPDGKYRNVSPCRRLFPENKTDINFLSRLNQISTSSKSGSNNNLFALVSSACHFGAEEHKAEEAVLETATNSNGQNIFAVKPGNLFRQLHPSDLTSQDLGFLNTTTANNYELQTSTSNNIMSPKYRRIPFNTQDMQTGLDTMSAEPAAMIVDMMTSSDPMAIFSHPSSNMDTVSSPSNNITGRPKRWSQPLNPTKFVNQLFNTSQTFNNNQKNTEGSNALLAPHYNENKYTPSSLFKMKPCSVKKMTHRRSSSPAVLVTDNGLLHQLPCFDSPKDAIRRITAETLANLMDGAYDTLYDQLLIVDCRYPYEYEGGHIPSAININTPEQINSLLNLEANDSNNNGVSPHTIIVFHCEFSSERAPRMALHVRNMDRYLNRTCYPHLNYPEIYILDGGYKNFWETFADRCEPPQAYLPMRNPQYKEELRIHQRTRHAFKSACHLSQHTHALNKSASYNNNSTNSAKKKSPATNESTRRLFQLQLTVHSDTQNIDPFDVYSNSDAYGNFTASHYFPSHSIPQAKSLSSILPSEVDFPSEMDS